MKPLGFYLGLIVSFLSSIHFSRCFGILYSSLLTKVFNDFHCNPFCISLSTIIFIYKSGVYTLMFFFERGSSPQLTSILARTYSTYSYSTLDFSNFSDLERESKKRSFHNQLNIREIYSPKNMIPANRDHLF